MMSSTKRDIHNLLHCCQMRTELQPQVTRPENFVKFVHVVFETCKQKTCRHTAADCNILHPSFITTSKCKQSIYNNNNNNHFMALRDYLGEPVPEETPLLNINHPLSASFIYHDP